MHVIMRRQVLVFLSLAGGVGAACPARPLPEYVLVDLGQIGTVRYDVAEDINNAGVVVGQTIVDGLLRGYVWQAGQAFLLEQPPAPNRNTEVFAIGDRGHIVGLARDAFTGRAAMWAVQTLGFADLYPNDPWASYATDVNSQGVAVGQASIMNPFVTFGLPVRFPGPVRLGPLFDPPEDRGAAEGINDSGVVVGWVSRESPRIFDRPFLFDGAMHELPVLPSGLSQGRALAVNAAGQAVGWSLDAAVIDRAVFWPDRNTVVLLEQPPFGGTRANDINAAGQIVGGGSPGANSGAFLWHEGQLIDLNTFVPPGSPLVLTDARGINDLGQIVGYALNTATFDFRSFLLDPRDRDGDGLYDHWETNGIDVNADGIVDLDLPALGANPDEKDIFVEIDALTNLGPTVAQMDHAVRAFAAAPAALVGNFNGAPGINLRPFIDDTDVPVFGPTDLQFADLHLVKGMYFGSAAERANPNAANILKAKALVFHYCLFVNEMATPTVLGVGELPGNDFIVALGGGWPAEVQNDPTLTEFADWIPAAVFMHELGHNLGLGHGGRDPQTNSVDDDQFKPNYRSVMNYKWTLPRNWNCDDWRLDYSRVRLPLLDENDLVETFGMGGDPHVFVEAFGANGMKNWFPEGGPADFDGDEMIDPFDPAYPLRVDLNRDQRDPNGAVIPKFSVLAGREDWSALLFKRTAQWGPGVTFSVSHDHDFTPENVLSDFILAGDITGDCRVNLADVARLMVNYGVAGGATPLDGDYDANGAVDFDDAEFLMKRLGVDCGP